MVLVRKQNYRNVRLYGCFTGETVGVFKTSGELSYFPFLGFTDRDAAMIYRENKPVKLSIYGYHALNDACSPFIELNANTAVQGCMTPLGVYAIVCNGEPRCVRVGNITQQT